MSLSKNWIQNFYHEYIGYSWRQSIVTDGGCKYNTSCTWNSRTFYDTTGYGTLCTTSSTLSPTLRPLWPIAWTTQRTQTCWPRSIEHTARRLDVSSYMRSYVTLAQGSRPRLVTSSHPCMCTWLFDLSSSLSLSTSSPSSSSTSSWFLPWCLTTTPWMTPCETPLSGAWSAWTMSHPTQVMSPRTWSSQTPMSSTSRPPAISTSRTPSKIQSSFSNVPDIDDDELARASCNRGR